ncbi:hypothetical protein GCM10017774_37780 [Lentzea cavernae]|uniref:Uncharacterized protein n=1 Tax=Lentzea cavernae TaxID=2020703 RepID=A0ABQ3ML46_9PSEU|nr:hypothetical protein GCM10017774_37780 [Lentzea cavernae]
MRALKRAVLEYWFATVEDPDSALLAATRACWEVNVLDEAVFEAVHGEAYRRRREGQFEGRTVMGLELIRNCETHAPIAFESLLVVDQAVGVPLSGERVSAIMRPIYAWAFFGDLPADYIKITGDTTAKRVRARKEAVHGYRAGVSGRHVIETLLDAIAFFEGLDDRLLVGAAPGGTARFLRVADGQIFRTFGLERFALELPDLACRPQERRRPEQPAADRYLQAARKDVAKKSKKLVPAAEARQVFHKIMNGSKEVGYSGYTLARSGYRAPWVERTAQIHRDIENGYRYYIIPSSLDKIDETMIEFETAGQLSDELLTVELRAKGRGVVADVGCGKDLLNELKESSVAGLNHEWLEVLEKYPDLYLNMRRDGER